MAQSAQRRDRPRVLLLMTTALLLFASQAACVGSRPKTCARQSECAAQSAVCDGHGFCSKECESDRDCPCLSFCAPLCGICIRNDLAAPATCFGQNRDMPSAAILGACGIREEPDSGASSAAEAGGEERACDPQAPLPQCSMDPPQVYQPRDSGMEADVASEAGDAAEAHEAEPDNDADHDGPPDGDAAENDSGGSR